MSASPRSQLAKKIGAEVYGTASPAKHEAIRGFGVDHPIDYTRSGWERNVPKLDLVMDAIGGPSFRAQLQPAAPRGPADRVRRLGGGLRQQAQRS